MADIKTPLCALQPTPAIPHTASRSGAGTRGGERGLERAPAAARRGAARHGTERASRQPPARRPAGLASPRLSPRRLRPAASRPPRAGLGRAKKARRALGAPRGALERAAAARSGRDARACVPGAGTCHRGAGGAGRAQRSAVREVQGLRTKNAREITGRLLRQTKLLSHNPYQVRHQISGQSPIQGSL